MLAHLRAAFVLFAILSVITGVAYPLAITAIAQVAFAAKANGSILTDAKGKPIGSAFIGQEFAPPTSDTAAAHAKWFWGRPSATSPVPYTALNLDTRTGSSGSNLAPSNPALLDNIKVRIAALDAADASVGIVRVQPGSGIRTALVPIDLVTASASGLDPHISPAATEYQIPRIAKARGLTEDAVRTLVHQHTQDRWLGLLGERVVNVLGLNQDLDNIPR
jgi:K+-transporting ATPase ATPase C chain